MKKNNLLLLSSSNHVQLVNSFNDAYNRLNLKGKVYTADIQKICASSMVSNKHFTVPRSDSREFFPTLEKLIKENDIDIVLSTRDEELELLSKNKNFFDDLNCFLLISDENSVLLCRNKYKLNKFFSKNGIPHPKSYLYEEIKNNENIKYPILCKPIFGKGGIGIFLANNINEIEIQVKNSSDYLFQEYIEGIEYTIDALNDLEGNVLSLIPRKRVLVKGGESILSITEKNETLLNYAKIISEKIGFIGHINIQCIMKEKIPYFIEINPRFGGASNLAFKAGMDSPYKIMQMLNGEKVSPFIGEFKENFMMLRYTQDFFVDLNK